LNLRTQQPREETFVEHGRPEESTREYYSKKNLNIYADNQEENDSQSSKTSEANHQEKKVNLETGNEGRCDSLKASSPIKIHDTSSFVNSVSGEDGVQEYERDNQENTCGDKSEDYGDSSKVDDAMEVENTKEVVIDSKNYDEIIEEKKIKIENSESTVSS